jgi:hypothetical protein
MYARCLETSRCALLILLLFATASTDAFLPAHHGFTRGQGRSRIAYRYATTSAASSTTRVAGHDEVVPPSILVDEQEDRVQADNSALLACRPPEMLHELDVGETLSLQSTPIEITRVASKPDIFVLRNLLPDPTDRDALISEAAPTGLEDAETKAGHVVHRTKSSVAWVYPALDDKSSSAGKDVASFMTGFCTQLFLNENLLECDDYEPEDAVQIAQYTKGGRFDLHHDAYGRIVTVLTYLNGIAGTWFPFAQMIPRSENADNVDDEEPPVMTLGGVGMTDGKVPGQDGVWIVGDEYESKDDNDNPHVVRVRAGDAVVFYNYEYNEEISGPIMSWRSLHAGMPASQEKWIATNWFSSDLMEKPTLPLSPS